MTIQINASIHLTPYRESDTPALVELLNDPSIYENTLTIPYPYGERDADFWFRLLDAKMKEHGSQTEWAIRNEKGELMGGIGRLVLAGMKCHWDEIGYWIGKPYRNQGIMTEVLKGFTEYCNKNFGLVRITANVFTYNLSSAKALEKAGFLKEGYKRKAYEKNKKYLDAVLYAKVY